jgi:succinate dehydrogenase/fumarate reductase flavoprotein subunit
VSTLSRRDHYYSQKKNDENIPMAEFTKFGKRRRRRRRAICLEAESNPPVRPACDYVMGFLEINAKDFP